MTRVLSALAALAALPLLGCGAPASPPPSISAASYNQACTVPDDCTPVLVGELCDCRCSYAAINKADQARYDADRARISCSGDKLCGPCQQATATCTAGRCAIQ